MTVFIVSNMFKEALEVSRTIKQTSEICDNCPRYGN